MPRRKVPFAEMRKSIIEQTIKAVGANARFVEAGLEIRPKTGTPNWDANISIAPTKVIQAFAQALAKMQNEFDIEW
jgi:hypothetical protein